MTAVKGTHLRHDLLAKVGQVVFGLSVDVYDPPKPRGTIFCLHDFAGVGMDFDVAARFFAANGFRVVCLDFPGRGRSAVMTDPALYARPLYIAAVMQAMQTFALRRVFLIGKGWGGLVALLLLNTAKFKLYGLILSDLALDWRVESDPVLLEALGASRNLFPSAEEAVSAALWGYEFRKLNPEVAVKLAARRIRQTPAGFAAHYDPALRENLGALKGVRFDVPKLLGRLAAPLLYLSSDPISEPARAALQPFVQGKGAAIGDMAPGSRIHFTSPEQLMLVHGFMTARSYPADPAA